MFLPTRVRFDIHQPPNGPSRIINLVVWHELEIGRLPPKGASSSFEMALLTAPTAASATATHSSLESSLSIRQYSELVRRYARQLGTALRRSDKVHPALSVLAQAILHVNRIAITYLLLGSRVAALQALLVAKKLATMSVAALSKLVWGAWNSKQSSRLRKKIEFEFFALILGSGNGIILMMFWPGWLLVGLAYFLYLLCSLVG